MINRRKFESSWEILDNDILSQLKDFEQKESYTNSINYGSSLDNIEFHRLKNTKPNRYLNNDDNYWGLRMLYNRNN